MNTKQPNLFDYATSELSQDALICWLIKWADKQFATIDSQLHKLGQLFVKSLIKNSEKSILNIEIKKQWNNIDILVIIDNDLILTIEDKTITTEHNNQLARYKETVEKEYGSPKYELIFVYIKTWNEPPSKIHSINSLGWEIVLRKEFLQIISSYQGQNSIILDYIDYLSAIEYETIGFKYLPVSEWKHLSWQGFYMELEKHLSIVDWGYVNNRSKPFWGVWWHFVPLRNNSEVKMYLQFEESKFCFKIIRKENTTSTIKKDLITKLFELFEGKGFNEISKPKRIRGGKTMTIAIVDSENMFGCGIVSIDKIISKLKEYEKLVDECCTKEVDL